MIAAIYARKSTEQAAGRSLIAAGKGSTLQLPIVVCCLVLVACGSGTDAPPPHEVVGQQGIVRFIVLSPELADQDETLWQIAEHLRRDTPNQAIDAMFWTNSGDAATGLPLTARSLETQVAQISINPVTNHRELTRPQRRKE